LNQKLLFPLPFILHSQNKIQPINLHSHTRYFLLPLVPDLYVYCGVGGMSSNASSAGRDGGTDMATFR
jgi:hypothetical protein